MTLEGVSTELARVDIVSSIAWMGGVRWFCTYACYAGTLQQRWVYALPLSLQGGVVEQAKL